MDQSICTSYWLNPKRGKWNKGDKTDIAQLQAMCQVAQSGCKGPLLSLLNLKSSISKEQELSLFEIKRQGACTRRV